MPTEMHWYNGGTWKKAEEMYVWDSSTSSWKEAIRMYIWDDGLGSWRQCHISPNACFDFNGDNVAFTSPCCLDACSFGGNTVFRSNCADPFYEYGIIDCYIYAGVSCTSPVSSTYIQLNVGGTQYNFGTDFSGKITSAAVVTC